MASKVSAIQRPHDVPEKIGKYVIINKIGKGSTGTVFNNRQIEALSKGEQKDIHQTMIAMEKASLSFELMMQIRNKAIAAYDEIRRMPI